MVWSVVPHCAIKRHWGPRLVKDAKSEDPRIRPALYRANPGGLRDGLEGVMTAFLIKVALGLFAFVVSILGVTDLKSVSEQTGLEEIGWWRRLTRWGVVKIFCAAATLALLGINEYLSYEKDMQSTGETEQLRQKLEEARSALGANLIQLKRLSRTNDYLVRALDKSTVRLATLRVVSSDISSSSVELKEENGKGFEPKKGDVIEWGFVCAGGPVPRYPSAAEDEECSGVGYGRLMANGYPINLRESMGRQVFFGTRSTGGTMEFRSSAEVFRCSGPASEMKKALCELQISVSRDARWEFRNFEDAPEDPDTATQDACRRYEALYGESCDEALKKSGRR